MTKNDRNKFIGLTFLLTALPTMVFANAGSPMMWFGILHSLILNAFIGWTESSILDNYKIPNRTWLIIIGNYISMFIGLYYIAPHFSTITGNSDFWGGKTRLGDYELTGFSAGMVSSYFATLVIEFPFFFLAVKDKLQRRQLFFSFLIANTITNVVMTIIYFWIASVGGHW